MVGYGIEKKNDRRELTANDYGEAGIVSGIATRCIIQPLDVLKIRFQVVVVDAFMYGHFLFKTTSFFD